MMRRTTEEWIEKYKEKNAYWRHNGNPNSRHALLTSGNHSDGFFQSKAITDDPELLKEACDDLYTICTNQMECQNIQRVVGPQTGATKLAEALATAINYNGGKANWASPSKSGEGIKKTMIFEDPSRTVLPKECVLLCEDVITTGGSIELTAHAVREKGGLLFPFVACLVNRSGSCVINGQIIISLVDRPMNVWKPQDCPLCRRGSIAISPKRPETNWALLNE